MYRKYVFGKTYGRKKLSNYESFKKELNILKKKGYDTSYYELYTKDDLEIMIADYKANKKVLNMRDLVRKEVIKVDIQTAKSIVSNIVLLLIFFSYNCR